MSNLYVGIVICNVKNSYYCILLYVHLYEFCTQLRLTAVSYRIKDEIKDGIKHKTMLRFVRQSVSPSSF